MYGCVFDVRLRASSVRPWKPPSKPMTAERRVCERANLIAFSIASAPELKNPVRVSPAMGASAASR